MNKLNDLIRKIDSELNVIMLCRFGSHLYGTDTEKSDLDLKGVFMPTPQQILTGNIPDHVNYDTNPGNTKNGPDDIDCELYSFQYFMKLCAKGEMISMDMIHANDENIFIQSPVWEKIHSVRSLFYTTEMRAFVGYAKKQAAKYGEKGSRLESADKLIAYLEQFDAEERMHGVWGNLPIDENMRHKPQPPGGVSMHMMQFTFCGKCIQSTQTVQYTIDMIDKFKASYGARARKAQANDGVDWKAMSHALRASYQIAEIFRTGNLQFPLKEATFLRNIKTEQMDFKLVSAALEHALLEVDKLAEISSYPPAVDQAIIDWFTETEALKVVT